MFDTVILKIEKEKVTNAKDFFSAIKSISHEFSSLDQDKIITLCIESKLNHELAWEIVQKEDYVRKFYALINDNLLAWRKLYSLALLKLDFPENYEKVILLLLYLYQKHDNQHIKHHQTIVVNVIYDLLLNPAFRNCFYQDDKIVPLYAEGFYNELVKFITTECKDDSVQKELLMSCKPRELNPSFVDGELKKLFGYKDPLSPEQEDMIAIHKFLADVSAGSPVLKQLKNLEAELETFADKNYDAANKTLQGYQEGMVFQDKKIQRLFSQFFCQWAEKNNFFGYAKFKRFLDEDEFLDKLESGFLFKDSTFQGTKHGDFSHAIQWYMICMWNKENPSHPKLKCDPVHLLKWIGKNKRGPEWYKTFEISGKSIYKPTAIDFRNTQHINNYLKSESCPFPVLHQLSLAREAKGTPHPQENKFDVFKSK